MFDRNWFCVESYHTEEPLAWGCASACCFSGKSTLTDSLVAAAGIIAQ
jgi:hypothetical protein